MALFFASGGGRLGNQILNLIHLTALTYEYDIKIYKVNDLFIESRSNSLLFEVQKNKNNWKIIKGLKNHNFFGILFLRLYIRLIHLFFHILPNKRSYKIGYISTLPKFIFGKYLKNKYSLSKFINESRSSNIIVSGWGLRDWGLVLKHKKKIINNILKGFKKTNFKKDFLDQRFLVVHIRRTDFLRVKEFESLNFSDSTWLNSILKICSISSINRVVLFSDELVSPSFLTSLETNGINVILPENTKGNKADFLDLFVSHISKASLVICNSSTLALGISFLFHDYIYIPSKKLDFQKIKIDKAHTLRPTSLTWN